MPADWFAGRLPDGWFAGDPTVVVDREEITVIGQLPNPTATRARPGRPGGSPSSVRRPAASGMRIADEAQDRFGRKVSWGVQTGGERSAVHPYRRPGDDQGSQQPERQVLDTLVDAGVARSRSDALAWSVKLVGEHTEEWLARLREAMTAVDDVRAEGPGL